MHSFKVHSNESACRKSGRLGLEQVFSTVISIFFICHLAFPTFYGDSFRVIFRVMCRFAQVQSVNAINSFILWWVFIGLITLRLFLLLFPFFFFGTGSSWDFMVLTSCVASSNLTVLARLLFPLEGAPLYLYGFSAEILSVYYLRTLHSSEECPAGATQQACLFRTSQHITRVACIVSLALASSDLLGFGWRGRCSPLFLPYITGMVILFPLSIFVRGSSFIVFLLNLHAL